MRRKQNKNFSFLCIFFILTFAFSNLSVYVSQTKYHPHLLCITNAKYISKRVPLNAILNWNISHHLTNVKKKKKQSFSYKHKKWENDKFKSMCKLKHKQVYLELSKMNSSLSFAVRKFFFFFCFFFSYNIAEIVVEFLVCFSLAIFVAVVLVVSRIKKLFTRRKNLFFYTSHCFGIFVLFFVFAFFPFPRQ